MKNKIFNLFLCLISIIIFTNSKSRPMYTESEIILQTSTGDIIGTLTIPSNIKTSPLVIIVAGSGPTDRDGNSPGLLSTNCYKMLAQELATKGISSIRYDKRGVGKSASALKSENEIRFESYVDDVVAWAKLLKSNTKFSKIIIAGHSEGSLLGILACEQVQVDGFITLAGAGRRIDYLLLDQISVQSPFLVEDTKKILDSLAAGKRVEEVNPYLQALFRPSVQPYLISWIKYDPSKEIKKLTIPVLIIQGSTDIQTGIEEGKMLSAAKPDAKLVIIDKMNHIFKESDNDVQKNSATYKDPNLPLKKELVPEIVNFINSIK